MTVLFASDLDRTLIYSRRAMELGRPVADPVCVEVYDGVPTSFMTPAALTALAALSHRVVFVPTTTRTLEQFRRIRLPGVAAPYAITTNGARILDQGEPCPEWERRIDAGLAGVAPYAEAAARLEPLWQRPWVLKRRSAEDRFRYVVVEPGLVDPDWVAEVEACATGLGWTVSVQGRKIYAIPGTLTKEAALAEVVERAGADVVVAAGDSLLDRGLLTAADHAVRPAHGELHEVGWSPAGLHVTEQAGGRAAEEIVTLAASLGAERAAGTG